MNQRNHGAQHMPVWITRSRKWNAANGILEDKLIYIRQKVRGMTNVDDWIINELDTPEERIRWSVEARVEATRSIRSILGPFIWTIPSCPYSNRLLTSKIDFYQEEKNNCFLIEIRSLRSIWFLVSSHLGDVIFFLQANQLEHVIYLHSTNYSSIHLENLSHLPVRKNIMQSKLRESWSV